nr:hypothetical protein [Tanacetum cinerariifolium]
MDIYNLVLPFQLNDAENGNYFKPVPRTTANADGTSTSTISGSVTTKEKAQKKNNVKARSMLLMALPNKHLLTFSQYKDAKTLFEAIQARFGSPNMAFLSSPDNTNEVDTASIQVSAVSIAVSTVSSHDNTDNLSDATVYAFLENQPNGSQLVHEDLKQIHEDDIEEMDLKWQLALLSMRARRPRNQDSSKKTVNVEDTSSKAMVAIDGAGFDWSYMADDEVLTNMDLMAFSDSEVQKLVLKNMEKEMVQREVRPVWNNATRTNHQNFSNSRRNFAPTAVLTKSDIVPISTARQNSSRAAAPVSAAKPINTNASKPLGAPQDALKDQGYFDSGCSRHMIGNISYLTDFKEHDEGYVAFGGGAKGGKITGKAPSELATHDESMLWHRRLGHINFKNINKLVKNNLVRGLPSKRFENNQTCVACLKGKRHKVSFKSKLQNFISQPLFMLYIDLFGLTSVSSIMHKKYCLVITDDFSRFTWVFFLATKDETSRILKSFITKIENLVEKKIKIIRCDNGIEFKNRVMNEFCEEKGIKREFSMARTPQQNRVLVVKPHFKTPYELFKVKLLEYTTLGLDRLRNMHITFLENKPMIAGGGLEWLFDIDALSKSMNYAPVSEGTNSNDFAGKGASFNADGHNKDKHGPSQASKSDNQERPNAESSTKTVNTIRPVNTATPTYADYPNDPLMSDLEDAGIFDDAYDDRDKGTLVDLPPRKRAIGTKWVYRNKRDQRGIVVRNKARLVAQGRRQEEGIYYDEVFAPVARIEAIRLFIAYASFMDFTVYQMDRKSAFLYGTIEEEVYVSQPSGFVDPEFPDRYGLHQAPRAWYETLSTYLLDNGFRRGIIDKTLFIKKIKDDILLVQVYVDDIIFGSTKSVKSASTPIETHKPLSKDAAGTNVDVHLYRSMIGSLMYVTSSRPDIMFVVCACSRFQVQPKVSHMHAVKRIFTDLKGQPTFGLWYPKNSPLELITYFDSDYAGASLDRKSTTGGCQFLGSRLISWQCKKQTIVANSTTEAEYIAASNCYG